VKEGGKSLQDASQKFVGRVGAYCLAHTHLGRVEELHVCVVVLQDQLVELQTAIGTTLEYFQELDEASDKLVGVAKSAGDVGYRLFLNLRSYKLELVDRKQCTSVTMRNNGKVCGTLMKLSESVETIIPKGKSLANANGDIGDLIEQEMVGAARAIETAMQRPQQLMACPYDSTRFSAVDLQVHDLTLAEEHQVSANCSRHEVSVRGSQACCVCPTFLNEMNYLFCNYIMMSGLKHAYFEI
jgi:hypothetical protein